MPNLPLVANFDGSAYPGDGSLTERMNEIVDPLNLLIERYNEEGEPGKRRGGTAIATFPAKLGSATLQGGHQARWTYTFAEVSIASNGTATPIPVANGGRTGTTFNLVELAHAVEPAASLPWLVWSVDAHGTDYPAGFNPKPVQANAVVTVTRRVNAADGAIFYTFEGWGSHDGTCAT